jgi:GTPase SAR1 family protein
MQHWKVLYFWSNGNSFIVLDVRTWFSNIEQHASEGVNRILIGNKCDMTDKKVSWLPDCLLHINIKFRSLNVAPVAFYCVLGYPH